MPYLKNLLVQRDIYLKHMQTDAKYERFTGATAVDMIRQQRLSGELSGAFHTSPTTRRVVRNQLRSVLVLSLHVGTQAGEVRERLIADGADAGRSAGSVYSHVRTQRARAGHPATAHAARERHAAAGGVCAPGVHVEVGGVAETPAALGVSARSSGGVDELARTAATARRRVRPTTAVPPHATMQHQTSPSPEARRPALATAQRRPAAVRPSSSPSSAALVRVDGLL